jgi:hypothetical protein
MPKVKVGAVIVLEEIVLARYNRMIDAEFLAEQDGHMEHMILNLFPEEWRENITVNLESVEVYSEGDE